MAARWWQPRRRVAPPQSVPRSVSHCSRNGAKCLWIYTWPVHGGGPIRRHAYRCRSWRCKHCAPGESRVLLGRISEGFENVPASELVFGVLTLDQEGHTTGKRWPDVETAFRELSRLSNRFFHRLNRALARAGRPRIQKWIATVEQHRTGWPHVNVAIHSADVARSVSASQELRARAGVSGKGLLWAEGTLLEMLVGSGWGPRSTLEVAHSKQALQRYMVKCAGEFDAIAGEVSKYSQLPISAPIRTRRLRSSVRCLPARRRKMAIVHLVDEDGNPLFDSDGKPIFGEVPANTGVMIVRKPCPTGFVDVVPTNKVAPERQERARHCCAHEELVWLEEQRELARVRELPRPIKAELAEWAIAFERELAMPKGVVNVDLAAWAKDRAPP